MARVALPPVLTCESPFLPDGRHSALDNLIEVLRQWCREKPGAANRWRGPDRFEILDGFLDTFAEFYRDETPPVLMVRCGNALRERLAAESPAVRVSERMGPQKGKDWAWTDVALDGSVPAETLRELIDHSYQRVYDGLNDLQRLQVSMIARGLARRRSSRSEVGWVEPQRPSPLGLDPAYFDSISIWADPRDTARGDFTNVHTDYQCGERGGSGCRSRRVGRRDATHRDRTGAAW